MTFPLPARLAESCRTHAQRRAWLAALPATVADLAGRWALQLSAPFDGEDGSCAWVAAARRADGAEAVLKVGMPHLEGEHEIAGLMFWNGDPTVRVLEADEARAAALLECCQPGTSLRRLPEAEQDLIIARLLRRLWRPPPAAPHPFRPLAVMLAHWRAATIADADRWPDAGLVRAGLQAFDGLTASAPAAPVLLATDLHAGNVLAAQREPWLVIDPKPFTGDPAYDATQHLLNCLPRVGADPARTISHFSGALGVDPGRVRGWLFARLAAEPRDVWDGNDHLRLARALGS